MGDVEEIKSKLDELEDQLRDCKTPKVKKLEIQDEILKWTKRLEEEEKKKREKDQCNEETANQSKTYEIDEDELEL